MGKLKHCPECTALNSLVVTRNIFGEMIMVIICKECGSFSVSKDGMSWIIIVKDNAKIQETQLK